MKNKSFNPALFHKKEHPCVREITISRGLQARISPKGRIVWQSRFRLNGKQCRVDIGPYPNINENDAKDAIVLINKAIAVGKDPRLLDINKKNAREEVRRLKKEIDAIEKDGYVYLAIDKNDPMMVKIGHSLDPITRTSDISISYGRDFLIFSTVFTKKAFYVEKSVHRKLKDKLVERELFNVNKTEALIAVLDSVILN
ncbi:MAG: integrase arm-type DNA-binding domain-containing protein [Methylobacter sp.]